MHAGLDTGGGHKKRAQTQCSRHAVSGKDWTSGLPRPRNGAGIRPSRSQTFETGQLRPDVADVRARRQWSHRPGRGNSRGNWQGGFFEDFVRHRHVANLFLLAQPRTSPKCHWHDIVPRRPVSGFDPAASLGEPHPAVVEPRRLGLDFDPEASLDEPSRAVVEAGAAS
mmetsp:Transcript_99060/g.279886  ORF Transcript_99060/g.279886 Transcript_99060/m.279886 type:complete len:168 (+) Transcript_99060:1480-1983(+)